MDMLADTSLFLVKSYNYPLVILSVCIAVLSSFTAFGAAERIRSSPNKSQKVIWNLFGAFTMGMGIWAMHFIGMIALILPVSVSYNISITLFSVVPAIFASGVVLWIMTIESYKNSHLLLAGILLGSGIGIMHYSGMAAMELQASMVHNSSLFYLSIATAVTLATIALKIQTFQSNNKEKWQGNLFGATAMGLATSSMHYVAMAAANFLPSAAPFTHNGFRSSTLVIVVVGVIATILLIAILLPILLRYKQVSKELNTTVERLGLALSAAKQGWFDFNLVTGEVLVSDGYPELLGYSEEEFHSNSKSWLSFIHPEDKDTVLDFFNKATLTKNVKPIEYRRKTKNGGWIWFSSIGRVIEWDTEGVPSRVVGVQTDISQRKEQQQQLESMAHYDALTGLPNRTLFTDRFHLAIAHSDQEELFLAVCFIDLDNFKPVNDTFGHNVGDQLLIEVADRIKSCIRAEDTISRQGGDEFALLLNDIQSQAQCKQTISRLHKLLATPFLINGNVINISASSGITLYPSDKGDIDTLLRHADHAMYQAKQDGRNQYQFFSTEKNLKIIQKNYEIGEIKQALENNEFELYYQPKVNMLSGEVYGAEALIRWIHPEKGLIPPLNFLPVLYGTELEITLGDWVVNEALSQLDIWKKSGVTLEVSINVSSHYLQSITFYGRLNNALIRHPSVDSQYLQLEILESSALVDVKAIGNIITNCQNILGINIALDDFGTGYSSLTHLRDLTANVIKIDPGFVQNVLTDPSDYRIIEAIIGLAQAFDRDIIAEGVESDAHGLMLLITGCYKAQGYGISRPLPAEQLSTWIDNYRPNQYWLDYGSEKHSLQENKVILLQLITQYWYENIINVIHTMPDSGFEEFIVKPPLSTWIIRFEQESIFSKASLRGIKQAHDSIFSLANHLVDLHEKGLIEEARQGLPDFENSYEKLCCLFEAI